MLGNPVAVVLLIVGTAILAWFAWISFQSLLQGMLLREAREGGASGLEPGRRVALHGPVRLTTPIRKTGLGELLWYHCKVQERRGWGKRARWVTVGDETEMAVFGIDVRGREVRVEGFPTEVQSEESRTEYSSPGCLGIIASNGDEKTITEYLPVMPRLTLVGRLEQRGTEWVVEKDSRVGLLLSPEEPGRAAFWEILKGTLGLVAVTAAVVAGIWFYYSTAR